MSAPEGDGDVQYCPRCGAENVIWILNIWEGKEHVVNVRPCQGCTWKVRWVGPLWGEAVR